MNAAAQQRLNEHESLVLASIDAMRQALAQAEREPDHWIIRLGNGKPLTTWLAFDENGKPIGAFKPQHARQYLHKAEAYNVARYARNGAGDRGEAVTYRQALADEIQAAQQRLDDHRAWVAEMLNDTAE